MTFISLASNIPSLRAQRQLNATTERLGTVFQRLSSGLRINSAKDDPAGLAVGTALKSDSRVFAQAVRNANDTISALNIAEGALRELESITSRQQELATQAANESNTLAQRRALDSEAAALSSEFNRILASTTFNGRTLLSSATTLSTQLGYGTVNTVTQGFGTELDRTIGSLAYGTGTTYALAGAATDFESGDFNEDGIDDLVTIATSRVAIQLGNGDGTFRFVINQLTGAQEAAVGDFNNDGNLDVATLTPGSSGPVSIYLGNGNGTFLAAKNLTVSSGSDIDVFDHDGDGDDDLVTVGATTWLIKSNGDGTFASSQLGSTSSVGITTGDFNNDGNDDYVSHNTVSNLLYTSNGNGTFSVRTISISAFGLGYDARDLNNDGNLDLVSASGATVNVILGCGNGSFGPESSYTTTSSGQVELVDLDNDGYLDIVAGSTGGNFSVLQGRGDGTFGAATTITTGMTVDPFTTGDFNGDGVLDIVYGNSGLSGQRVQLQTTTTTNNAQRYYLLSTEGAQEALTLLEEQLTRVTAELGAIGAGLSRLDVAVRNLQATQVNLEAAVSRIFDVDIAQETAELVRLQILQQASSSVLAQANLQPELALRLLDV